MGANRRRARKGEIRRHHQGANALASAEWSDSAGCGDHPGACWEGIDLHEPGPEEVYVVSGVFNDGVRDYPAGSFIHNPKGSSHVPQSKTGCTIFVFYPEG